LLLLLGLLGSLFLVFVAAGGRLLVAALLGFGGLLILVFVFFLVAFFLVAFFLIVGALARLGRVVFSAEFHAVARTSSSHVTSPSMWPHPVQCRRRIFA